VALDASVSFVFSEAILRGSGLIELRTAQGELVEQFDAATSDRLRIQDSTLVIDPTQTLAEGTRFVLHLPAGAFTDQAGNAFAGGSDYDFTTLTPINTVVGTARGETLNGGQGVDHLFGLGGNDTLNAGAGDDLLDGGIGADRMTGGAGNDTYVVENLGDRVIESAGQGVDTLMTSLASYTLPAHVENLVYSGNATFRGIGNALDNRIEGGRRADTLEGGTGADVMIGGQGADRFVLSALGDSGVTAALRDLILDFERGTDRIDVSAIDAQSARGGNQAFSWRGAAPINGAGQIAISYDAESDVTVISGNVNANLAADFSIGLRGNFVGLLGPTDFIL
jgi:Ca2+-binding RTX toxin-like protein